jgi:hypothetical protein
MWAVVVALLLVAPLHSGCGALFAPRVASGPVQARVDGGGSSGDGGGNPTPVPQGPQLAGREVVLEGVAMSLAARLTSGGHAEFVNLRLLHDDSVVVRVLGVRDPVTHELVTPLGLVAWRLRPEPEAVLERETSGGATGCVGGRPARRHACPPPLPPPPPTPTSARL